MATADEFVGSVRRFDAVDGMSASVLVLVTGFNSEIGSVAVTLLSPDVELGGSGDLLLGTGETCLAYSVLVESDVFGYVPVPTVGARCRELGRVPAGVLTSLTALRNDEQVGARVAGPPIVECLDPRWAFKVGELARLRAAITG